MYAIISLQGKQYRVEEGQRLFVDRLGQPAGATFHPTVLFIGGDGAAEFSPKGAQVTARVVQDVLGDKIRIGKYRAKTGYRRQTGHRSQLTEVEITAIGTKPAARKAAEKPAAEAEAETKGAAEPKAKAKPKAAAAEKKPAARKPAKTTEESS